MSIRQLCFVTIVCAVSAAGPVSAQDATIPGEISTPYPTIHNLAVEWRIQGDDNLNGVVKVQFRKNGDTAWREGMPLRRIPAGAWAEDREARAQVPDWSWENKHSGSVFDLQPDTEYEIRLQLNDPDGGTAERTVRVKTRPVPVAMPGARIVHADPENFHEKAAQAEPGDLFLLAPGFYGYFAVTRDGAPGKPIVFRHDPDARMGSRQLKGAALFDGVSLQNRRHVYIEEIYSSDAIDLLNAKDCVIRRCRIHAVFGIIASCPSTTWAPALIKRLDPPATPELWRTRELPPGATPRPYAENCYIADNILVGMTVWTSDAMAVDGKNLGEGIQITGPGNVICHNRVSGFRDCISTMEDQYAVNQVCIDIYNNDIYVGPDDGIESDFCMGNCRIMRNRITNCFMGMSSQPGLGGPTYFIRNVMYNITRAPYKFSRHSRGNVVLHNTTVKTGDGAVCSGLDNDMRSLFWNNIAIGGGGLRKFGSRYDNGKGLAADFPIADATSIFDYNGYGTHGMSFRGVIGGRSFDSQESLRVNTSEKHGVQIGLNIFATPVVIPDPALNEWLPPDFRLRSGSAAVDAGIVIPNINDDYTGQAPDLGAYELGQELPVYGPRNEME